jgi:hypothetical protein
MAAQNVDRLPSRDNQLTPQNSGTADEVIATPLICQEDKNYMYLAAISCVLLLILLILIIVLLVKIKLKNRKINEMVKKNEIRIRNETEGCRSMPTQSENEIEIEIENEIGNEIGNGIEIENNNLNAASSSKEVLPRSNTQNMKELLKN